MTKAGLYAFMARHKLGVLATTGPTGASQSALMGIAVTPDLEIVFDTIKTSRKYPNLTANQACSFVVGWGVSRRFSTKEWHSRWRVPS